MSSIPLGSLVRIELFSIWAVGAEKIRNTTYFFFRIKGLCFCDVLSLGISNQSCHSVLTHRILLSKVHRD